MHDIIEGEIAYYDFIDTTFCGTAVWGGNKVGINSLRVQGVTVDHESVVKTVGGRWKWPVMKDGIFQASLSRPATGGEKVWVDRVSGRMDGQWFDGAVQVTNMTFLTDGERPWIEIVDTGIDIPPPDFYMPLEGTIDSYNMRQDFLEVPQPSFHMPLRDSLLTFVNGEQVFPVPEPLPPEPDEEIIDV